MKSNDLSASQIYNERCNHVLCAIVTSCAGLPVPSGPLSHCAPSYAAAHTQSTGPESGNSQSPAQLQPTESQPRQMDVSSLLGMVAPGIIAQPDLHSQWFSKNMAGGSGPQDMSAALLGMQTTMDAAPEPPLAENVRIALRVLLVMGLSFSRAVVARDFVFLYS